MADQHRRHLRSPFDRARRHFKSRTVRAEPAQAVATGGGSLQLAVSTNFWMVWMEIAIGHMREADQAHAAAVALRSRGEPPSGDELRSALQAVTAAGFAIDGFYGAVGDIAQVPTALRQAWRANKTKRETRILETLKHGFNVGPHAASWGKELDWLFDLRGGGVHHVPRFEPPVYRPELDSGFSAEHVRYSATAARRATVFALTLMATCLRDPKTHTQDFANGHSNVAEAYETALAEL